MVSAPSGYTCNSDHSICFRRNSAATMPNALETCSGNQARVCMYNDLQRLCSDGIDALSSGDWIGDRGYLGGSSDDAYFSLNRDTCSSNIDSTAKSSAELRAFACCRSGELTEGATPECPAGLQGGHTANGEVCMSGLRSAKNAHDAIQDCWGLGGHVCTMMDMFQLCGAGLNPYEGAN